MISVSDIKKQDVVNRVYQFGQEHIFRFWTTLSDDQKERLIDQVEMIDFELLNKLIVQSSGGQKQHPTGQLVPPGVISLNRRKARDQSAALIGEKALREGKVAAVLVAGGQGTRLGFEGPKGMYPVTPVRKKCLFQLHAEKLISLGKKFDVQIPWYIMTSLTNEIQTIQFFSDNDYFGYQKENIFFFVQEMIPAIDRNGKLILDHNDHIFMNPNGHGGSIKALFKSGALADMKKRGVDHIFYFQVDNVLTRICDPAYIGYHILGKSEMSCKVVRKKYAEEKIGILCKIDEILHLIEYSDLDKANMYATNPDGLLKFWAGNIATHIFNRTFLERENEGGFKLPYHIAEKSISYVNDEGKIIQPTKKNGIKFETFVFDALTDARQTVCLEIEREKEFSPLKNKEGENSPETVHKDLVELYAGWFEEAGQQVKRDSEGMSRIDIEISPLLALNATDLIEKKIKLHDDDGSVYVDE